ncbi:MAG: malate synthase A [Acidobacteria bacterium]|nr:malate synthase A [Acidobacteriota bacterium]
MPIEQKSGSKTVRESELNQILQADNIEIRAYVSEEFREILTPEALRFVATLVKKFSGSREELLSKRAERQSRIDAGEMPNFLKETKEIRESVWKVAPLPQDLQDRRVEITGPVDRKMVINALNSGAKVFMADFEDSHSPTWEATIQGQINLRDAINRTITYSSPEGKQYKLNEKVAVLMVRPRGWHLIEKNVLIDGKTISGGLFDFGLFFFHNAKTLIEKGTGPYFYLPKMESHLEARLWNSAFVLAQDTLGISQGTIKATVLIETILAAFEMDEILYELKEHSAGLNCGRWDYIFSFIKKFRNYANCILPDRAQVTMATHFLSSYSLLLIQTCHKRGVHAMGGMAAQIPIKNDPQANQIAIDKVIADKKREVSNGHDGTWVAHPGLVPIAMQEFDQAMPTPNQIHRLREDVVVKAEDLLAVPSGTITLAGLRTNINVGMLYLEAWLRGTGCVPLYNLMEDAATAEISRAQVWQWIKHNAQLDNGERITKELVEKILAEELEKIKLSVGGENFSAGKYSLAGELFQKISTNDEFVDFLTLPAYQYLN